MFGQDGSQQTPSRPALNDGVYTFARACHEHKPALSQACPECVEGKGRRQNVEEENVHECKNGKTIREEYLLLRKSY